MPSSSKEFEIPWDYRPEIDISEELGHKDASYYQSLIGVLRWMMELGWVDICTECSMMSLNLALPRQGHTEALFHMFTYLKVHNNLEVVFDPAKPDIHMNAFPKEDLSLRIYGNVQEELSPQKLLEE